MKYFKFLVTILTFMFIFAGMSTYATTGSITYAGLTLPGFKKELMKGPRSKTTTKVQQYNNYSTINSCTGNNNDISVRVQSEKYGTTDPVTISVGATSTLGKGSDKVEAYNLYIKNNVFSPCGAYHSGVWYYN